jgi:hypothetical protein
MTDAVVEFTALVAFQSMSNKFNSALGEPGGSLYAMPIPAT